MTDTDLRQLHALLTAMRPDGQAAMAYDHASHGPCPFEDTDLDCPVCEPAPALFCAEDA